MSNGGSITGEIEIWIPGERVVVVTDGNQRMEFAASEIADVEIDDVYVIGSDSPPSTQPIWGTEQDYDPHADGARTQRTLVTAEPARAQRPRTNETVERLRRERYRLEGERYSLAGPIGALVLGVSAFSMGVFFAVVGSERESSDTDTFWGTHCDDEFMSCKRSRAQNIGIAATGIGLVTLIIGVLLLRNQAAQRRNRHDRLRDIDRQLELTVDGFRLRF